MEIRLEVVQPQPVTTPQDEPVEVWDRGPKHANCLVGRYLRKSNHVSRPSMDSRWDRNHT